MPTITTGDLEVIFPRVAKKKIEVAELEAGTEIAALKFVSDLKTTVTGDAAFVGKGVTESSVVLESTKKNTPKLVLQNTNFSKSDIKISGEGVGRINSNTGAFNESKITGGKKSDSIKFGNKSTVNNATIILGKGGDSITFGKGTTFKGKTTVNLTPGGKDVVTFGKNLESQNGFVVIKNFEKGDKLIVGNDTFTYNKIKNGVDIPGIRINLP